VRIPTADLRSAASSILEAVAVPVDDAALVGASLVMADAWGHQSHGLLRLPWYVNRIRSGVVDPVSPSEVVTDIGAIAVLDGHDGVGQVLAARAMRDAVRRAREHGIGAVAVRESNHFGTAAYFTRMAAAAGCIGILATNSSPAMAPWGGRERKTVGANPWSIAAPAGRYDVVALDIANTAVARGKIYLAQHEGRPIPPGWALDSTGAPTTDPAAALAGLISPMAEHKGYAISFMVDVLSGVLTGSGFGTQVSGPYQLDRRSRCGHLAIALDVDAFLPAAEFVTRVETLIEEVKSVPTTGGVDEVFFPGELETRSASKAEREGVALPSRTVRELRALAVEVGVSISV
jgi:LDH2 family malate/lactate/ureidoglycolate dehydrogenase